MGSRLKILLLILLGSGLLNSYLGSPWNPFTSISSLTSGGLKDNSASLPLDADTKATIRNYLAGVTVEPKENDLAHAIHLDHSVGRQQLSQGLYKEAHRTYQKVLAISYRQGNLMGVGIGLMIMADIAERSNDLDEALHATFLAYKVAQAMKNKEEVGVTELAFARRLKEKDPGLSTMWLLRARESLKESRYKEDYVRVLPSLAGALRKIHEDKGASALYDEAWEMAQSLGDSPAHKWTKWEVGVEVADDLARRKQHEKAQAVLSKTESYYSSNEKSSDSYLTVIFRLAEVYNALKKQTEARMAYLSGYSRYELARLNAPGADGRVKLDNNYKPRIDEFVDHYIQSNDAPAALALLESNKGRALSEVPEDPLFQAARGLWKAMQLMHAMERTRLLETGEIRKRSLMEDVIFKTLALTARQGEEAIQKQSELGLKGFLAPAHLSRDRVEDLRRQLPEDTALLSFFMGRDRSSVFVVTQSGIRHVPLPEPAEDYRRAIQQLRLALTNPHNDFHREPAQFLFRNLLEPAIRTLPVNIKVLVYIPDGPLSTIPLAALMDGERFAGERYGFYQLPSLRLIGSWEGLKAKPAVAAIACVDPEVANIRLPAQRQTGELLKKLYGDRIVALSGTDCSKDKLLNAVDKSDGPILLHVGAPGNLYPENEMDSAIWFSPGGSSMGRGQPWSAREMASVNMSRVELITLSSCEAGLTDPKSERDVFGILRPLLFAGVKKVVTPLWQIQDEAVGEFMQVFYRAYADNRPAVLSLQSAQSAFIRNEKYRHPHYWAGLVLTGGLQ